MDLTHVRFSGTELSPLRSGLPRGVPAPARARRSTEAPGVTGLAATVLAGAGLDPLHYRAAPLQRRTPACLRVLRSGTQSDALSALLIGFSGFFRDADVFETLEQKVIPRVRGLARPVRVLSVGCSSGQELYSLAMLFAEHDLLARAQLVGVDCRADAVAAARDGIFPPALVSEVPERLRTRYFEPAACGVRAQQRLRARTRWHVMDATRAIPPGPWDIVLCRNLFIYLQPLTIDAMLAMMVDHLAPLGVLVVGKAERPSVSLGLKSVGRCIYSRHAL